jgi:hypothetical protein
MNTVRLQAAPPRFFALQPMEGSLLPEVFSIQESIPHTNNETRNSSIVGMQEPCPAQFCEVVFADENHGKQMPGPSYSPKNS